MQRSNGRCEAFTLIEMLVVVSILSLLLAILLPSMSRARGQARSTLCLTHLSQLGQATHLYAGQFGDYVPQVFGGPVPWTEKKGALYRLVVATEILPDAISFPKILVCPDARPRGSISYALNSVVFGYQHQQLGDEPKPAPTPDEDDFDPSGLNIPPLKLSGVNSPGQVVALYDVRVDALARVQHSRVDDNDPLAWHTNESDISDQFTATGMLGNARPNDAGFMWQQSLDDEPYTAEPPHGRSHNVLFVDGHAGTFARWEPTQMTRLTGREPNDTELH